MSTPLRPLTRVGVVAGLLAALIALTAAADPDQEVAWGVKTAPADTGEGRQYYAFIAAPGTTIDDVLIISNHDDADLTLDVYGADGFTTESGQLDVLPRAEESTELGSWITFGEDSVTIPAGESAEVPFTVHIPDNATPGDYAGGVITSLPSPVQDAGVTVDRRLGVRVQLRVDGDLQPGAVISDLSVTYTPTVNPIGTATAEIAYTVRNAGNTRWSATQTVELSGPFGLFRTTAAGADPIPELLPGDSWSVTARSDQIILLFWLTADVTLDPAGPEGFGDDHVPAPPSAAAGVIAMPWAALVVLAAVAAGILLWARQRRRRRAAEDARVRAAVEEALAAEKAARP